MPKDLALFVEGKRLTQFSGFTLGRAMDVVGSGVSFDAPFFPAERVYRDLFRPRKHQVVEALIGGKLVFTGTMDFVTPKGSATKTSVSIQCRSKAGVTVDCTFEKSDFPIQFSKAKLDEIAEAVLVKFGLTASFPDGPGALFEEAGPSSPTDTVFSFLQNLARQRELLITDDASGNIVFYRARTTAAPVATLAEGQQGVTVSEGRYDGTKSYSSFDVFGQEKGKSDNHARVVDPSMEGIIRPKSIQANDTNAANIKGSAEWAATTSIAAAIAVPLRVTDWDKENGDLWNPGDIITLASPGIMIYKPYAFIIKSVVLQDLPSSQVADFTMTIPNAYSGELPTRYPWDE